MVYPQFTLSHATMKLEINNDQYTGLTYPVPFVSRINVYFRISRCATNLQKLEVGFSTQPYMCVTRSRTTSFRMSGVNLFSSIALLMEGPHLLGIAWYNLAVLFQLPHYWAPTKWRLLIGMAKVFSRRMIEWVCQPQHIVRMQTYQAMLDQQE